MAGTLFLNGDEGSSSLTKFYVEITYEYSEAPFSENLTQDILGPNFATADLYDEVLTIGDGISLGQFKYGALNDPNESSNWSIGDPSGAGDWLGNDYYRGSVGQITTSSAGYDTWRDAGRPRPNNYDEKPSSIWVIKYLDGAELEQVKATADEVIYPDDGGSEGDSASTDGTLGDALEQIAAFFDSKSIAASQFVDEYASVLPPDTFRPFTTFDTEEVYGIEAASVSHSSDVQSLLKSPLEAATTWLIANALTKAGMGALAETFVTLDSAQTFQSSLNSLFIAPGLALLDLLADENGNLVDADTLNKWLKANEIHQDAVAKFIFQNTATVGSVLENLAFAGRDTGDALMGSVIDTGIADGYFASSAGAYFDATSLRYVGSQSADNVYGTAGQDYIFGGHANDSVWGGDGNDWIGGGDGDDMLSGAEGNDLIAGGDGDDNISGDTGRDKLWGGKGADFILGGDDNDKVKGQGGNDTILGGDGADKLAGNGGHDFIYGGDSKDVLKGGGGKDVLTGGAGSDKLFGNKGADVFVFHKDSGVDRVMDMRLGQNDSIHIITEDLEVSTLPELDDLVFEDAEDIYLSFGDGDLLIIENATWSEVRDFVDLI